MEKESIQNAITNFSQSPQGGLTGSALHLFNTLGYDTSRSNPLPHKTFAYLESAFALPETFNAEKARVKDWRYFDILFQLSASEISMQAELWDNRQVDDKLIESYLFAVIELNENEYIRSRLAQICREVNKIFPMPVMILFRYGENITLSVIDRRINKKRGDKDVLEKVTLIKDISVLNPHRAHIEILDALSLEELRTNFTITNFVELHNAWQKTLDTKELNKRFYNNLYNWYEWALTLVKYPSGNAKKPHILDKENSGDEKEIRKNLIRLITRLIFVWFLKQKGRDGLVPDGIFRADYLQNLLNDFNPVDTKNGNYYNAVLQNLFFATLNRAINERSFADDESEQGNKQYGIKFYYRDDKNKTFFKIPREEFIGLFSGVPFLNGGLFECLDYMRPPDYKTPVCVDGFSREAARRALVPNVLFFGAGRKEKTREIEKGIINIFNSYVFTIEENTPIEQDIALDPELLGKVFENLLATYNPETRESARNDTGSFYTPREIVEYMADTSLKEYFKGKLGGGSLPPRSSRFASSATPSAGDTPATPPSPSTKISLDEKLDALIQYNDVPHGFNDTEKEILIEAIDTCKILDPACGSGAFPMGILHKLTFILGKLDPGNILWKERQKKKLEAIQDITIKKTLEETIDNSFKSGELDYSRKLYLIENCIFGVDIQTIAIQISKLRFFISLIVDQTTDPSKDNLGLIPLPNLETKFVAANTLLGLPKPNNDLENIHLEALKKEMLETRHKLFSARTANEKRNYREEEKNKRKEIQQELIDYNWPGESAKNIAEWDPYDQNASSEWFDSEWMFGVKEKNGFDIVIGNPPYVRADSPAIAGQRKIILQSGQYETLWEKWDLMIPFFEKGIKMLADGGFLALISSDAITTSKYAEKLQAWIMSKHFVRSIDYFENIKVFEAGVTPVVIFVQANKKDISKITRKIYRKDTFANAETVMIKNDGKNLQSRIFRKSFSDMFNPTIVSDRLGDICYISYGLRPNSDEKTAKGEFAKDDLISDTKDKIHCKEYVEGKNIEAYRINKIRYLEFYTNRVPKKLVRPTFENLFTGEKLLRGILTKGTFDDTGIICNHSIIVFKRFCDLKGIEERSISVSISKNNFEEHGGKTTAKVKKRRIELEKLSEHYSLKYILAVINSSYAMAYLNNYRRHRLENYFYPDDFREFPLAKIPPAEQKPVIALVDQILAAKSTNPQADTSELERRIDNLVYRLYNLTYDEVKVIEPGFPMNRAEYEGSEGEKTYEKR